MFTLMRPALSLMLVMTLLTGVAYPLLVTAVAQVAFAPQANGSLVTDDRGQVRGSTLLAQAFTEDRWFHPRPSAGAFATLPSGASNLASSNPALAARMNTDAAALFVPGQGPVPLALVTTSASGLDPHLPPEAIDYQVARVAQARGLSVPRVQALVAQYTETSLIGPPVINVLALNLALDRLPSAAP